MNSSKYSRTSNYEPKPMHRPYWKKKDTFLINYSHSTTPLSQFVKENDSRSNYIDFADINLNELTKENFNSSIDKIISFLNKPEPKKEDEKTSFKNDISKEAIINIMHYGLCFHKSAPVINLLINIKNTKETEKAESDGYNCDDLIIFYLKRVCLDFEKFDDFLDSMVFLTGYLTKNIIKNNLNEEESNNLNDLDKEKDKEKSTKPQIQNVNNTLLNNFIEMIIKYIYSSCRFDIYCLYPILSTVLSILCKTNTHPACEILLNLLYLYKINFSTSAINSYIDFLCRNNFLEDCHELLSNMVKYIPEYSLPKNIDIFLKEKYGENHTQKEEGEKEIINNFKINCEKNLISYGINIVSFGIYLKYLCKGDYLELALFYYDQLNKNNILKDEVIYNLILNGCSKKLDIKNLHRIYMDMINKGITPNLITFNTIIDAFIRNKNTEKAFGIFNDMINNKINPDNFTLSTLFKGINKPEHNKYLIQGVDIINKNIYPVDIILINVLLDACIKLKDKKNFCEIFENIIGKKYKNISPDLITYNTFIKGCSKFKLYDKVEYAFNHLIENSKETNIVPNDVTFNSLIDVYVSQKNMDKVLQIVNLMQRYKIYPDNYTYTTIIKGLNKNSLMKNPKIENIKLKKDL